MNPLLDFEPADVSVDVDGNSEENFQIYYRETYRWVYLSEQATDEVWIFRQHDSDMGYGSGRSNFLPMVCVRGICCLELSGETFD